MANGYVKIPGALSAPALARVRSWVAQIAAWPDVSDAWMHHFEASGLDPGKLILSRTENIIPYHAELAQLLMTGVPARLAGDALGEDAVLYKEKINYKAPGGGGYASHQDAAAYAEADRHVTCMLALDSATPTNGCLEFAPFPWERKELIGLTPEGTISSEVAGTLDLQPVTVEAGDAIVFSSYVPHRSTPNHSMQTRHLLYLTYNKKSLGDLRSQYYSNKRASMQHGRLSMIGHFQGELVGSSEGAPDVPLAARPDLPSAAWARAAVVEKIANLFEQRGATRYDAFSTQEEHALMTALMAQRHGADLDTVVAAFLHDIGHLLLNEHAGRDDFLVADKRHEEIGYRFLRRSGFPEEVTELVRLHVEAKRYLCAADPSYYAGLSEASKCSLELQGGPVAAEEIAGWAARPLASAAAELRRWEDEGKRSWAQGEVTGEALPTREALLEATRQVLEASARHATAS